MVELAIIPVLGALLLLGISVLVLCSRSGRVAAVKKNLVEEVAAVMEKDRENDRQLVEALIEGVPTDECFARHSRGRAHAFPGGHLAGDRWTKDDLDAWRKSQQHDRIEAVNRGLMLPASTAAIFIIAVCVTAVWLCYGFFASRPVAPPSFGVPAIAAPGSLPPADLGPPWTPTPAPLPDTANPADVGPPDPPRSPANSPSAPATEQENPSSTTTPQAPPPSAAKSADRIVWSCHHE